MKALLLAALLLPAAHTVTLDTLPMAAALSPDGKYLLALNAEYNPPSISVLDLAAAKEVSRAPVADAWLGLAFAPKGNLVYVGGGAQAAVFEFSFASGKLTPTRTFPVVEAAKRTNRDFVGDVALSPDGRLIYAANLFQNSITVINPQSGRIIDQFKTCRRPYRILFPPDGKSFFVSCWADGMVLRHETASGNVMSKYLLAPHPTDMIWVPGTPQPALEGDTTPYVARIFVTASNTNSVRVLGVAESGDVKASETVSLALSPLQPAGMTPSALALDAGRKRLYVACSDANALAVLDISETVSRVIGYIPTGSYPTAVRVLADGRVVVLNGKNVKSYREPGSASFVDSFGTEELAAYTKTVQKHFPYRDSMLDDAGSPEGSPVPSWPGDPTPIRQVVYIVNEGRTYDQVLGDLKSGNGEVTLAEFGEKVTPNQHRLAREYVLLDHFYASGDTSADGESWAVAGIAPDFVQKLLAARRATNFGPNEPGAVPPAGYLWTNARSAGVSFKDYPRAGSDLEQARLVLQDLAEFEKTGQMPRLLLVRLGASSAADNDRALGMLVDGITKSSFWPTTAVLVSAASAGSGPDHVDPHRAPAFVVSPYARRGVLDSAMYNTTSMLRTVELILGLQPMTQFDAAARPLSACFQARPATAR